MELKNRYSFYASVFERMDEFIHSEMVEEKHWFCDYEKQAIKLAVKTFNELSQFIDKVDVNSK
jgi:hypothetical protein